MLDKGCAVLLFLAGVRLWAFWLQQWQIREYRTDRMRDHLSTVDGRRKLWRGWVFPGILPRPSVSGRMLMVVGIGGAISLVLLVLPLSFSWSWTVTLLLWNLLTPLCITLGVVFSRIPVGWGKRLLFIQARKVIKSADPNITRIALSGSYGKSSTKTLLVHVLESYFGAENVLYNPRNNNNEVAVARLILNNREWLTRREDHPRFLVIETGAYARGEVRSIAEVIEPEYGIITGLNLQHLSLFGSVANIQDGECELAEVTRKRVFFNAESELLAEAMEHKMFDAERVGVSLSGVSDIVSDLEKTTFTWNGQSFTLPWGGEFFIQNALLVLHLVQALGLDLSRVAEAMASISPLERALRVTRTSRGAAVLWDLYSANPDGVMSAIDHLRKIKGHKIFIGIPLIELGESAERTHRQIFEMLAAESVSVFWLKEDFASLGREICGEHFHGADMEALRRRLESLGAGDGVLLESRLPGGILDLIHK